MHDVTDASALRSWFNPPLATSLAADLYKVGSLYRASIISLLIYEEVDKSRRIYPGAMYT